MPFRLIAQSLHPGDDIRREVDQHLREGRTHFDRTFRLRHAHGHWVTVRLRGHITRDTETGEPYLTALAGAEQDIAVSVDANARLRDAVETISEAFVLWDHQNRLLMCNSKYQQFHGLPDGAIRPGATYEEVIAAASDPVIRKRVVVDGGSDDGCCTYEAQLEDGRWLHINERRTRDGGYVSVGTDITVLKESQQRLAESEQQLRASVAELRLSRRELEQQKQQLVDLAEKYALEKNRAEAANRAKSEFLANISHELRTPLNAVIGFSEVMEQGLFGPLGHAKYHEYARDIHGSGTFLLEVINDILDMSKIEAGRMTLDIETVDVADIVEDSMKVVSQTAAERDISLARHGPTRLMLEADRRALKQIFLNLLVQRGEVHRRRRQRRRPSVAGARPGAHRHQGHRHRHPRDRYLEARAPVRAGREPVLQEPPGQRARARHLPGAGRAPWRVAADREPRGPRHHRHLHASGQGRDRSPRGSERDRLSPAPIIPSRYGRRLPARRQACPATLLRGSGNPAFPTRGRASP